MANWIKKIFGKHKRAAGAGGQCVQGNGAQAPTVGDSSYSSDQPISLRRDDRFNRWPFAKRIADTLAGRRDPSSIVIGLYGPWGDGKTSTLHLMEEALADHPHVVVVRFNPWYYQSEEKLLRGFFSTLAATLGKSLPTKKEHIGDALKKYGSILSLASVAVGGVITIKPGDAAKSVGEALSTVELDELKERIEQILADTGTYVVVLIDDIDRLDRIETHAIFKLVKLSAGFRFTRYVLSFDDEMVAAAIGERYGQGGYEAGRSFLEKIIQVPLHLPPPDQDALRAMTFEGVQTALNQAEIALSQAQADAFGRHFVDGLEPGLATPRHSKVYVNALTFALPLMKSEANPVDLMLMEGIRVFYPKLYAAIRDNSDLFLKSDRGNNQQDQARREQLAEAINQGLRGRDESKIGAIRRRLLEVLFPRISRMGYGHEWDRIWARDQRVCSGQYFRRYFTYGVPPGDVADTEIARLVDDFNIRNAAQQDADLRGYGERNAFPQLIRKLREREEEVDPVTARALALALARNGALPPQERGGVFVSTFAQTGILVSHLLKRIPAGNERDALCDEIFREVMPLSFGTECLRWVRHNEERTEADRIVTAAAETRVSIALTERIRVRAAERPLYLDYGRDTPILFWLWNEQAGGTVVSDHLQARFAAQPGEVDVFLDSFVGESWGLESGLPRRSDFDRGSYDAICRLIDPELIVANLRARYGAETEAAEFHHDDQVPTVRRIALQFAFIHRSVVEERARAALAPAVAPPEQGHA